MPESGAPMVIRAPGVDTLNTWRTRLYGAG